MSARAFWRAAAVSTLLAAWGATVGCESGAVRAPTAPGAAPSLSPTPAPGSAGAIGGTVTINGEVRPIVWVEFQRGGGLWAFGTTIPSGGWEWNQVPVGDGVVVIKPPPGLTCDATTKSVTVKAGERTVVNFACLGDVKGSIVGFTNNEFGSRALSRISLTGPVNMETVSNSDGFFAFEDLPPGEYLVGPCNSVSVGVRDGVTAYATVDCS